MPAGVLSGVSSTSWLSRVSRVAGVEVAVTLGAVAVMELPLDCEPDVCTAEVPE